MNTLKIVFFAGVIFFLASCSPKLSPFSQNLVRQNGWTEDELQKIQYYLSDDIVLKRNFTRGSSEIVAGEIKMVNGRQIEEVRIPEGTPGVVLFQPKKDRIAVSFENGKDSRYLMFGPNPKVGDRYVLLAKEWSKNGGVVTYNGRTYQTDRESAFSALMIDLKKIKKTKVQSRVAKGRKI